MTIPRLILTLIALSFLSAALAQTTVRIMGYGGNQDPVIVAGLLNDVIADELAAEGITVQYEPLQDYDPAIVNALSAGTAADIFQLPSATAPGLIATGRLLPLDGLVDTEAFIPALIETYTIDGTLYGIPKDFNTLAVFYNEDLFDEAGVEYPNAEDTWETFAEKLRGVAALGDDVYGACLGADFARMGAFAYANGWEPLDEEGNTDLLDPAFVEAFEWFTGLVREGVAVQPSDIGAGWPGDCLAGDNVGVALEGAWMITFLNSSAPNLQYGTTLMPKAATGDRGNFLFAGAWGVNADSPNRDAALKVLELLTSEEAQQYTLETGLAIPSRTVLSDSPFFAEETPQAQANLTIFEGASDGNVFGFQFGAIGTDFLAPINNALSAVMTGQQDVETALQSAQAELDALSERARTRQ
ncbi:MAG: extracellular solute-binding protein [Deinococcota bacterium]|nr:extracellular solute-binding protein [Deinococcota bacterium]